MNHDHYHDSHVHLKLFPSQLNNYKNIEEGTVGRILSYYDLSDRKALIIEDEDALEEEEEEEQAKMEEELKKEHDQEQEKLKEEEEARRVMEEEEKKRLDEEEEMERQRLENRSEEQKLREEERGSRDPVTSEEIFRSVNRRRASMAMAKNKKADTSKTFERDKTQPALLIHASMITDHTCVNEPQSFG